MEHHLTATECHLAYEMGSHSVTCYPTQVNTPRRYREASDPSVVMKS